MGLQVRKVLRLENSEARECANTNRASIENNRTGNIDMNIVAKQDLKFHGISLQPIACMPDTWLTASQIGYALGYADDKSVQRIYSRHADEFTEKMTGVVKVTTPYGDQMTRAFSLRGAHLLAMFARTPVAKEFRRWVLDILDREVSTGTVPVKFDFQLYAGNADAACNMLDQIWEIFSQELDPALRSLGSPVASRLVGRINEARAISHSIRGGLMRATGVKKGIMH